MSSYRRGRGVGVLDGFSNVVTKLLGPSIPYQLPGREGAIGPAIGFLPLIGHLALIVVFVVVTVAGEETMFRGLIQTQVGNKYGWIVGLFLAAALFGLRHLPADVFYAGA